MDNTKILQIIGDLDRDPSGLILVETKMDGEFKGIFEGWQHHSIVGRGKGVRP